MVNPHMMVTLAYLGALAATLLLAAILTPASWWKRPNVLAACVLAGGTWGLGGLGLEWFAGASARGAPQQAAAALVPPGVADPAAPAPQAAPQRFITHQDLNLRSGASTSARRLAVVPAGAIVTTTGQRAGDWWQVTTTGAKPPMTGWTNSLWLRRELEAANGAPPPQHKSG